MTLAAEITRPTCQACLYFMPNESSVGTCHRYPPQYASNGNPNEYHRWKYPSVGLHGWCGEFRPAHE